MVGQLLYLQTKIELQKKNKLDNNPGSVHHIALWVSQSTIRVAERKLKNNNYENTGIKDRGFMDSLYFR